MRAHVVLFITVAVGVAAAQTPSIDSGGVLNGASFDKTPGVPLAPGQLISIFGSNLAASLTLNDTVPLSTTLADSVSVTVNGVTAGLDFVSATQINAQLPWNVLPSGTTAGTASVVVTRNGNSSTPVTINVGPFAPGVFSDPAGAGCAIAINYSDGSLACPAGSIPGLTTHPAKSGDLLIIYATGLGAVNVAVANGATPSQTATTTTTPVVLIGGVQASVPFSGLTPQYPGVYQLNVIVPSGVASGVVPLQLQFNEGAATTSAVTIAIQ
jgi:uncharacterized protein (TIGR03437 family)